MQVIEDMEEYILCLFFSGEELNIIQNKHINHLVEMNEVILCVVLYSINKLIRKFFRGDIQNNFFRVLILYFNTYGMHKMGLSHSDTTIYKKRVEGSSTGFACYCITGRA